jgi:hypothetical protein
MVRRRRRCLVRPTDFEATKTFLSQSTRRTQSEKNFNRFPSRLSGFARGLPLVAFLKGTKPMSLAKPRSRKGEQNWVFSASQRLRERTVFGVSKPQRHFSRRAPGERRGRKAHRSVFFAPSRLRERIAFSRTPDQEQNPCLSQSREAAKESKMGFSPRLRASARERFFGVSKPEGGQNWVVRNRPRLISTAQLLTCVSKR